MDVSATIYNVIETYISRWLLLTTCFDRQAIIMSSKVKRIVRGIVHLHGIPVVNKMTRYEILKQYQLSKNL